MKVTAHAQHGEKWWVVSVDEVEGLFTQTRRLDEIPDMVRDALTLCPEITTTPWETEVEIIVDEPFITDIHEAKEATQEAARLQVEAAAKIRSIATRLRERGLSFKDIATLLDVSVARAQQLCR